MSTYIIHHQGAYNFYSEVTESAVYERALTLAQVEAHTRKRYGEDGLQDLPTRLKRAHDTGSSAYDMNLAETISDNRAGPDESQLSAQDFIFLYLTLHVEA